MEIFAIGSIELLEAQVSDTTETDCSNAVRHLNNHSAFQTTNNILAIQTSIIHADHRMRSKLQRGK